MSDDDPLVRSLAWWYSFRYMYCITFVFEKYHGVIEVVEVKNLFFTTPGTHTDTEVLSYDCQCCPYTPTTVLALDFQYTPLESHRGSDP